MPDFDFDAYNHDEVEGDNYSEESAGNGVEPGSNGVDRNMENNVAKEAPEINIPAPASTSTDDVDKW
jgi:hypothetical protein